MSSLEFLQSTVVFLLAAIISVPLSRRLGLGSVLGYLIAGCAIGPFGLALITDDQEILSFAELGVVMMLFIVGLELSPRKLWRLRRTVFGAGSVQVGLSSALLAGVAMAAGIHHPTAWVVGFGLALSSTAAALQILAERKELTSNPGQTAIGISLFQDVASIPVLALLPLFTMEAAQHLQKVDATQALVGLGVVVLLIGVGSYALRPAFDWVARQRSQELFTASTLLVVFATALLMHSVGLSMALGAFIAGVLLADSEYRHELEANIEPFKGLLLGLFFIAIGMGMKLDLFRHYALQLTCAVLAMLAIKGVVLLGLGRLLKFNRREQWGFATVLAQGSEFAFVVFSAAASEHVLTKLEADFLILTVALSMALTPFLIALKDSWLKGDAEEPKRAFDELPDTEPRVIIAGFGRVGQIVARVLLAQRVSFTALDKSAEQVDFVRRFGNKIYYGDASRLELLRAAKAEQAELFVLAIDDVEASVTTAQMVRRNFPTLRIVARARNRNHAYRLMELGIGVVVRETFHSSLELSEHALVELGLDETLAHDRVDRFREVDERRLMEQAAVSGSEEALIASAREYTRELENLFEGDTRAK